MQLSKKILTQLNGTVHSVPSEVMLELPEKVLQFGTGVLLRGLPDYYIDKANKRRIFNGRIVVVKSTDRGGLDAFDMQHGLYTHCIKGVCNGQLMEEYIINGSISRVLSAKDQWKQILECASDPALEIIISNTTETGIVLLGDDDINGQPPVSFPVKLLAFLYERYKFFNGDVNKGMVIIPTELITDNGDKLQCIVLELAHLHKLNNTFIDWLNNANCFCNSLVDRIVPGKLPIVHQEAVEAKLGYTDELMITSEPYSLWAIETSNPKVKQVLSFAKADDSVVISTDITKHRELKLRMLNGTHTFTCGVAYLAGFETVKDAMDDETLGSYVHDLMIDEIVPCNCNETISISEALEFSVKVIDRFRNPYIDHKWLSITLNYTQKMKMRNLPVLLKHYQRDDSLPGLMALGFAAYLLFMKCEPAENGVYYGKANEITYKVEDEQAGYFHQLWKSNTTFELVKKALSNTELWSTDLSLLPGFATAVHFFLNSMIEKGVLKTLNKHRLKEQKTETNEK